jgi:GTP-binding protein HflX
VPGFEPPEPGAFAVSAATGQGLPALLQKLDEMLADRVRRVKVLLPYNQLALADVLRTHGTVLAEEYRDDGVYYEASVEAPRAHLFEPYLHFGDK